MFAPPGYIPFANIALELSERAQAFQDECTLPLAVNAASNGDHTRVLDAIPGKHLLREWLIDLCLWQQPVPAYLASPSGSIVAISRDPFEAECNLSDFDFEWPLDDAPEEMREEFRKRRSKAWRISDKYIFLTHLFTINLADVNQEPTPRSSLVSETVIHALRPFNGWSTCIWREDLAALRSEVSSAYQWPRLDREFGYDQLVNKERTRAGRPSKQASVRDAYFQLYPKGHEAAGHSLKEACAHVSGVIGVTVSTDTLGRALGRRK